MKTVNESSTREPKKYIVQKYRVKYLRENREDGRVTIINKRDVKEFCSRALSFLPVENICVIALDNSNRIIGYEAIEGATNQCALYPANCFRFLLSCGAASFVVAHNHPGGNTSPSSADWSITDRLYRAGRLLDLPLVDHIIVIDDSVVSLRESKKWESMI